MPNHADWKRRLYDCYITSGQAGYRLDDQDITAEPRAAGSAGKFVTLHLPRNRSIRIVDLGCGRGDLLRILSQAGYHNIGGVDASSEQISAAHARGATQAQLGTINEFLDATADYSVDVVLVLDVLEHMTEEELFLVTDGIFRILTRTGKCILHVPNAEGIYGMRVRYGDLTHERAFTRHSVTQLLLAAGFRSVNCYEDRPGVHGVKSLIRRVVWDCGTLPHRLLLAAETGRTRGFLLTQNIFVEAMK